MQTIALVNAERAGGCVEKAVMDLGRGEKSPGAGNAPGEGSPVSVLHMLGEEVVDFFLA